MLDRGDLSKAPRSGALLFLVAGRRRNSQQPWRNGCPRPPLAVRLRVPEAALRTGLPMPASPTLAACMAERMVDRLSLAQLRRIGDLPRAREAASATEFLGRVRSLRDPEILAVSSSSAALCATGLAR